MRKICFNKHHYQLMLFVSVLGICIPAKVYAAEPSETQFSTTNQLLNDFDLDSSTLLGDQKIYFGKDDGTSSLEWYIAGNDDSYDNKVLTLFATKPIGITKRFCSYNEAIDDEYVYYRTFDFSSIDCKYDSWIKDNIDLNVNHYGTSDAREYLNGLVGDNTDYFSEAEQAIMQICSVDTIDYRNSTYYLTDDLLYYDLCIKVTLNGIHYQGICLMA